jgi:FMN phosphatase YigB (HAD superfamily)
MIKLVITDLDNTLYDWVGSQIPAFNAMLAQLQRETGLPEQQLLDSFRRVHQRHGTSEYALALALAELDVLDGDPAARLARHAGSVAAFATVRDQTLRLYPHVIDTLRTLRREGRKVVAHTDAFMHYASLRVCQLGLEDVLDGLFAPAGHPFPNDQVPDRDLFSDAQRCRSRVPIHEELPNQLVKPDPEVLWDILDRFGVAASEAVYVGDSLSKDMLLAQRAGVADVFAAYGPNYDSDLYRRLVEITHWTAADVERETQLRAHEVTPTFRIDRFDELLAVVDQLDRAPRPAPAAA